MFIPRPGQWCLFSADLPKSVANREEEGMPPVHKVGDLLVGIYFAGGTTPEMKDVNGTLKQVDVKLPAELRVVDIFGNNVVCVKGGKLVNLGYPLVAVQDLQPMINKEHFPTYYKGNTEEDPKP